MNFFLFAGCYCNRESHVSPKPINQTLILIELTLVETNAACAPLAGHAVYLWHCTRSGEYSLYSESVTEEDYLRGVQATGSNNVIHTSQMALLEDVCKTVYATEGYENGTKNLSNDQFSSFCNVPCFESIFQDQKISHRLVPYPG